MKSIFCIAAAFFIFVFSAYSQCSIGPTAIPDNNAAGVNYTFNSQSVSDWANFKVQLTFNPEHTWSGDLMATVTVAGCASGNGTYTLFNFQIAGNGSSCDMNSTYTFVRSGTNYMSTNGGAASNPIPACSGGNLPTGTYTAAQQWPASGSCTGGTITVNISDNQNGDVGSATVNFAGTTGCFLLPVSLVYFTGNASGNTNLLTWATASEQNSSYFAVEYSTNNNNWIEISRIAAAGLSFTQKEYSYTHTNPAAGKNYYRLKQTDADGRIQYSKIILVATTVTSQDKLVIYPNPSSDGQVQFTINSTKNYPATIIITDAVGKKMYSSSLPVRNGVNGFTISTENFARGIYVVSLYSGGSLLQHSKLIVQ
jgi:hypothetical protein